MKILVLVAATFRELIARATLIVLAGISTFVLVVVAFTVSAEQSAEGVRLMLFGKEMAGLLPPERLFEIVSSVQASLARGLMLGVSILGVVATASAMPETMERGTVDLYLSKPIYRWELLLGRYLGAVGVILANVVYFLGVLLVIHGLKFGVWNWGLLVAIPLLTFIFAAVYALVLLLGVVSRSSAIAIIGTILFVLFVQPLLTAREATLYRLSESSVYRGIVDGIYYLFPQLNEMEMQVAGLITGGAFVWTSILTSAGSALVLGAAAAEILRRRDF